VPPELDSLMPPVSGLLPPTDIRPELAAGVPDKVPGANTSLLLGPSGWQVGGTSAATTVLVKARPPKVTHSAGTASVVTFKTVISTLMILSIPFSPSSVL